MMERCRPETSCFLRCAGGVDDLGPPRVDGWLARNVVSEFRAHSNLLVSEASDPFELTNLLRLRLRTGGLRMARGSQTGRLRMARQVSGLICAETVEVPQLQSVNSAVVFHLGNRQVNRGDSTRAVLG